MNGKQSGFTLIELLVAITIIAVLVGLSVVAVQAGLNKVQQTKATNNLYQIGLAVKLYATDNNETLPGSQHQGNSWLGGLEPYLNGTAIYKSPGDTNPRRIYSYAINDYVTPSPYGAANLDYSRVSRIKNPSMTLLMAECAEMNEGSDHFHFAASGASLEGFQEEVAVELYQGSSPYLFVDGHVEMIPWKKLQTTMFQSGSTFLNPGGQP